jgi:hypothetical protein
MEDNMWKFVSAVILSLLACNAHAATGGNIAGTVKGPDGAPFKAGFVRAQNTQNKMVTIVLSNAQGKYLVNDLAPGTYDVTAYLWSTRTERFEDARTITVIVR